MRIRARALSGKGAPIWMYNKLNRSDTERTFAIHDLGEPTTTRDVAAHPGTVRALLARPFQQ